MGYKASIITVKHPSNIFSNEEILEKLGFVDIAYLSETTFDESMYPKDKTINIGYYNDCLVILDDYQLTTSLELTNKPERLSSYENSLTNLFPIILNYNLYMKSW